MKIIATAALLTTAAIISTAQQPELVVPVGHMGNVNTMTFSPDNRFLATASEDRTAKVWDVRSGKLLHDLQGHTDNVFRAFFNTDGTQVVTISRDNTVKTWDIETGAILESVFSPVLLRERMAFSNDGTMLLSQNDLSDSETAILSLWRRKDDDWQLVHNFSGAYGMGRPFSPDGLRIMYVTNEGTVTVASTQNGTILQTFEKVPDLQYQGEFSPDGRFIAISSDAGLKIFDTLSGKLAGAFSSSTELFTFNNAGNVIALLTLEGEIRIIRVPDGKVLHLIPSSSLGAPAINTLLFSPDDNLLLIPTYDASIKLWDIRNNLVKDVIPGSYPAAFSHDGNFIAAAANAGLGLWSESLDQVPRIYEAGTGHLRHELKGHSKYISTAKFSPDGNMVLTDSWDRSARLWDIRNGRLSATLTGHSILIHSVEFSPDGKYILTGSKNETANLWDARTGSLLFSIIGDTAVDRVRYDTEFYAKFSPDNRFILCYTRYANFVRIYSMPEGELLYHLDFPAPVLHAVFSHGSNALAVATSEGTAGIWNLNTGNQISRIGEANFLPPRYGEGTLKAPVLSSDGNILILFNSPGEPEVRDALTGHILYVLESGLTFPADPFSPDSQYLITMNSDETDFYSGPGYTTEVRNAKTGEVIFSLKGESCPENAFSQDNSKFITFSAKGEINIWNTQTGKLIIRIPADTGDFGSVPSLIRFTPAGDKIITANFDGVIKVVDLKKGKTLKAFKLEEPFFPDQHFSSDGRYFMNITPNGNMQLWDFQVMKAVRDFEWKFNNALPFGSGNMFAFPEDKANDPLSVETFLFSPDGKYVLLSASDGTTTIIESLSGKVLKSFEPQNKPEEFDFYLSDKVFIGPFSPDGRTILGHYDGRDKIWDMEKGDWLPLAENTDRLADYTPDGRSVFEIRENGLKIIDVQTGEEKSFIEFPVFEGAQYTFSSDGRVLLASLNNKCSLWDTEKGEILLTLGESEDISDIPPVPAIDHESGFSSLIFSPDDQYIVTHSSFDIKLWNTADGGLLYNIPLEMETGGIASEPFSPDGKNLAVEMSTIRFDERYRLQGGDGYRVVSNTALIEVSSGVITRNFEGTTLPANGVISPPFSPDGRSILTLSEENAFTLWDVQSGALRHSPGWNDPGRMAGSAFFSRDGNYLLTTSFRANDLGYITKYEPLDLWNTSSGKLVRTIDIGSTRPSDIDWERAAIVSHINSKISLHSIVTGEERVSFLGVDDNDYVFILPSGYYMGSPRGVKSLSWRIGSKLYDFDQWDLQYNRPDKVLEQLGNTDPSLVQMYRKAYLKRLNKAGFTEEMFSSGWHTPVSEILNIEDFAVSVTEPLKKLVVSLSDSLYKLDRFNVWVNDVPVAGRNGFSLRGENSGNLVRTVEVILSAGRNKLQVSCTNEKGVESLKELVEVIYIPSVEVKPDLYLIAMCVSNYSDPYYDLTYAVKDGRDIVSMFSLKEGIGGEYNRVYVDTLFDSHATKEEFFSLKERLRLTRVDDQVILFVSGHGLLNAEADFYFATADIDFSKPEVRGISFEDMESLFDSIPARQKLIMMDACHSGEYDREEDAEIYALRAGSRGEGEQSGGTVREYDFGSQRGAASNTGVNLKSSFQLMQELFSGLDKGTGTIAISAAAGRGYALESAVWNNGVFTYSIINGLKNKAADKNGDNKVTISELKEYSVTEVEKLTNGNQKPTARREVGGADWRIW